MYTEISEYMLRSWEERRAHLILTEPCIEIGGNSGTSKGLLAHYLKTTIPAGKKIHLCHACNNAACSNPNHLYWGTPKENFADAKACGRVTSVAERTRKKYGDEVYRQIMSEASRKGGQSKPNRKQ